MKPRHLAFSLALALLLPVPPLFGAEPRYQESEAKLAEVRQRIRALQAEMQRERAEQDAASAELRRLDERVATVAARLRDVERQLDEAAARVGALERDVAAQQARITAHREQIARQLRAAYASGRGGNLKLLLNAEDPLRLGRVFVYHRYFQAAHRGEMDAAVAEVERLGELEQQLAAETEELEALRGRELRTQEEITLARAERRQALDAIEARLAAGGEELARLEADAAALEQLLAKLRDTLADVRDLRFDDRPFKAARGKLRWPLEGKLIARYGDRRGVGDMRWSGVLIAGKAGAEVRAPARGHVVFADWLRGFGLLLIVDHGDGFMTLYGHNEAIFKENGDWVEAGEVVASVGASGSQRRSGLYFEVRSGGKPVDPQRWLTAIRRD